MWPDGLFPRCPNTLKVPHAALVLNLAFRFHFTMRHIPDRLYKTAAVKTQVQMSLIFLTGMTRDIASSDFQSLTPGACLFILSD